MGAARRAMELIQFSSLCSPAERLAIGEGDRVDPRRRAQCVVSSAVTGRYREIGVRMALGATAQRLLIKIVRQTIRPVVVAVIGITAAGTSGHSGERYVRRQRG